MYVTRFPDMAFSLGKRLRAVRESLGLTQEEVIEHLETRYGITLSQQAISCIEHGKRKVDAEKELPALAGIYGKSIDYFYETLNLSSTPVPTSQKKSLIETDFEALSQRDKLKLAAELIKNVLQET